MLRQDSRVLQNHENMYAVFQNLASFRRAHALLYLLGRIQIKLKHIKIKGCFFYERGKPEYLGKIPGIRVDKEQS